MFIGFGIIKNLPDLMVSGTPCRKTRQYAENLAQLSSIHTCQHANVSAKTDNSYQQTIRCGCTVFTVISEHGCSLAG
jgi:hypothetical protein